MSSRHISDYFYVTWVTIFKIAAFRVGKNTLSISKILISDFMNCGLVFSTIALGMADGGINQITEPV